MRRRSRPLILLAALAVVAHPGAAAGADPTGSLAPQSGFCVVATAPDAPDASPGCAPAKPAPVAVVDVDGETYRIELTAPGALDGARALLSGASTATIPSGSIVRGDAGPNAPWGWHIDPASLTWAGVTTEICDGRPTQIEDGVLTIDQFCPWGARLLAIEHDPDAPPALPIGEPSALPVEASGGTSLDDRTYARRIVLQDGGYILRWKTGALLDPTLSGCPAVVQLLDSTGEPAPGSGTPYPTVQPDHRDELVWPDLPPGAYDLFLSLDCAWTVAFERAGSSAS